MRQKHLRTLIRAALGLQRCYGQTSRQSYDFSFSNRCDQLEWLVASRASIFQLHTELAQLRREALAAWRSKQAIRPPVLRDLMADLLQLEDEFEELRIDLRDKQLAAVTEPITLEGVYLGPFALTFDWPLNTQANSALRSQPQLRIVALDPHPANGHSNVTHPNVKDEILCAGEANYALQKALQQGRLLDALLLARAVLTTPSDSPYVNLDDWDSRQCSNCRESAEEEECGQCGDALCNDCSTTCQYCDATHCPECLSYCDHCGEDYCRGCSMRCSNCGNRNCCPGCAREVDGEDVCSDCQGACDSCDRTGLAKELEDGLCPACLELAEEERRVEEREAASAELVTEAEEEATQQHEADASVIQPQEASL